VNLRDEGEPGEGEFRLQAIPSLLAVTIGLLRKRFYPPLPVRSSPTSPSEGRDMGPAVITGPGQARKQLESSKSIPSPKTWMA